MKTKFYQIFLLAVLMGVPLESKGAILFEDNFNSRPDWSPVQNFDGKTCKLGDNCSDPIPDGYYDYRIAGYEVCSNLDGLHDTLNINSLNARGGSGKGLTVWNEACLSRSGSWGSDGLLGVDFAPQNEVYVRFWIKFQSDWQWEGDGYGARALGTAPTSPMQKFLHLSHMDALTANLWDFMSGTQNKPRFTPQLAKWGGGQYRVQMNLPYSPLTAARDNAASFSTNDYLGASPLDMRIPGPGGTPGAPADGNWHSFEFYVKLNSAGGVADGVGKAWYDGLQIASRSDVVWIPAGDNPSLWKWNHAWLGGNTFNRYFDTWLINHSYVAGDKVVFDAKNWTALQNHTSADNNKPFTGSAYWQNDGVVSNVNEQWYAVDDYTIYQPLTSGDPLWSSSPQDGRLPLNYVIGGSDTIAPSAPSGLVVQ